MIPSNEAIVIPVPDDMRGQRIDTFLASNAQTRLSRSAVQKYLADGKVTCDGVAVSKNYRVSPGNVITLRLAPPLLYEATPEDIPLDIVYEDDDIIVINKPRGLVVHPAAGHFNGTLVNALLYHCGGSLSGICGVQRPGIVHRLDKDTSGLMVAAKNDDAHRSLSGQLAARTVRRVYNAVCLGVIKTDGFTVDQPIGRHPVHRQKMAVRQTKKGMPKSNVSNESLPSGVRQAITYVKALDRLPTDKPRFTLCEARLETGRTHQIRVHMAYMGYPVLGDTLYGPEKQPYKTDGQVLHAAGLGFTHPLTGEAMAFEVGLPEYFKKALEQIGLYTM
jgi:23S rRNA pseudouridine1911/1915/1917 synthase